MQLCSVWAEEGFSQQRLHANVSKSVCKMVKEGIHTDITINVSGGSIGAHRALLAARSSVFRSMVSHNFSGERVFNHKHI